MKYRDVVGNKKQQQKNKTSSRKSLSYLFFLLSINKHMFMRCFPSWKSSWESLVTFNNVIYIVHWSQSSNVNRKLNSWKLRVESAKWKVNRFHIFIQQKLIIHVFFDFHEWKSENNEIRRKSLKVSYFHFPISFIVNLFFYLCCENNNTTKAIIYFELCFCFLGIEKRFFAY